MGYARRHLVNPDSPGAYHCISRCVRRAFLCGQDDITGKDFEHRRQWLENRIHQLAGSFAISVYAYAVMSNHVHLVLQLDPGLVADWSDDDVQTRWRRVFSKKPKRNKDPDRPEPSAEVVSPETLRNWRERLGSLSWFMKGLNEPLARLANIEDDCAGHFWEARFFSQALLDERAFLAAMAYADLNPVRAGMAKTLESSAYTGVARRLAKSNEPSDAVPTFACESIAAEAPTREPRLKPIAGAVSRFGPDVSESQYLDLVAWSAHQIVPGKASLTDPAASLKRIGCSEGEWQEQLNAIRLAWRVVGGSADVRRLAERIGQSRFNRRRKRLKRRGSAARTTAEGKTKPGSA